MQKKSVVKRDNKVFVIGILIIFLIALIVMNFGRFTGSVTKESSTILTITPDKMTGGEYVNIDLIPGKKGVYNQYYICYTYNDVCLARPRFSCSSFRCIKPVSDSYKSWAGWESGVYYVKVFDYEINGYVRSYFTIE
ncbi:hypothetical protein J4409_02565 [Candidatus Woesearchaeota archaeon]|nr:hypothetical protein [Candidatus Woesearchaeota archaeon]